MIPPLEYMIDARNDLRLLNVVSWNIRSTDDGLTKTYGTVPVLIGMSISFNTSNSPLVMAPTVL